MAMAKRFHALLLLLLALSPSEASQATIHPEVMVASLGGASIFSCTPDTSIMAVNVTWIINGTSLNDTQLKNVTTGFTPGDLSTGALKFGNTTLEHNNTRIQCLAITNTGDEMPSREAILLVQGRLSSVESLAAHFDGSNISLTWTAPFSLNLTFQEPDVTYCVDVVSSSATILHSECGIVGTEFTHPLPSESWCEEITVYVTSANVVGNGTQESMKISQALADYDPEVVNISILSNTQYRIEMSAPVCSANLVIVGSDMGKELFAVEGSDLGIALRQITFSTQQLKEKHSYDIIVRASNIAGYRLSETYLTINSVSLDTPTMQQGVTVSKVGIAIPVTLLGLAMAVVSLVGAVWLIRRSRRRQQERQEPVYILRGKRRGQKMSIKERIGNKITKVYKSENLPLRHTYEILHDTTSSA